MDRITDILVIANPLTREQPAIAKAATLARWVGAALEMLICDTRNLRQAHVEGGLPALSNVLLSDNFEALIEEFAQPVRDAGIGSAPLLLTKPAVWASPPVLLAAVDPGRVDDRTGILDHRILDVTTAVAKCSNAAVHAAHAYFPSTIGGAVAAEYIPRVAGECRADIVVMGAVSRSSLENLFIGSTAERVLETLPCDALVVKPTDFAQHLSF